MTEPRGLITEWKGLEGKTIERADISDYGRLLLRFSDGYAAVVGVGFVCDDSVALRTKLEDGDLVLLGFISEEEYRRRKEDDARADAERRKKREKAEYERLKAYYGD